jgi:type I restriction enzyme S subunit
MTTVCPLGWIEVRLGDISKIKTGTRNNQDKTELGRYPFFVRSSHVERIDSYSYDCEAILIPGEGGIGSIFHYTNGKFEVHQRVYKISDLANGISVKFIYYYMSHFFEEQAVRNSVKATVDSLRLPTFKNFSIVLPADIREQQAIADALTNADSLIASLERLMTKKQAIKQSMMQELLTGRTRLPVQETVA